MGRLENIVARNRRPGRMNERLIVSMVIGAIVLLIIALAVFTDFGLPPEARDAGDPPAPAVQEESDFSAKRSGAAMYSACCRVEDYPRRDAAAVAAGPDVIR